MVNAGQFLPPRFALSLHFVEFVDVLVWPASRKDLKDICVFR